jgi:hypothetical protein
MSITATLTNKRHLAAAHAAWIQTIPPPPEEGQEPQPWPYATVDAYVQAAIERVAESWRDSTRSDALPTAAFIRRIPPAAYAAIVAAAGVSPALQAYLARLDAEPVVWLGADETIAGVGALVAAGLLTQAQADAVLAYDVPQPPN